MRTVCRRFSHPSLKERTQIQVSHNCRIGESIRDPPSTFFKIFDGALQIRNYFLKESSTIG